MHLYKNEINHLEWRGICDPCPVHYPPLPLPHLSPGVGRRSVAVICSTYSQEPETSGTNCRDQNRTPSIYFWNSFINKICGVMRGVESLADGRDAGRSYPAEQWIHHANSTSRIWVKVAISLGYFLCVSVSAFILAIYYLVFWSGSNPNSSSSNSTNGTTDRLHCKWWHVPAGNLEHHTGI